MNRWYSLSQAAAKAALKFRVAEEIGLDMPCDIYECILRRDIDLQFMDVPSLEGMCLQEPEVSRICICSERPWGRQRFTAAHELGHVFFEHGSRIDEVLEAAQDSCALSDEELLADAFARFLLMPPRAVRRAVGGDPITPEGLFAASCYLGVGYETLVRQMTMSLNMIPRSQQEQLLKIRKKNIVRALVGDSSFKWDAWPLSKIWNGLTVHAQIGDILLGVDTAESLPSFSKVRMNGLQICEVGMHPVALLDGGRVTVKCSRRNYVGFYDYRYLLERE
jgi:Zn-dependent peptidase ImmA (M78 family)